MKCPYCNATDIEYTDLLDEVFEYETVIEYWDCNCRECGKQFYGKTFLVHSPEDDDSITIEKYNEWW